MRGRMSRVIPEPVSETVKTMYVPGASSELGGPMGFGDDRALGLQHQGAAGMAVGRRPHGVAGVDAEIQQRLLQFAGIGIDVSHVLAQGQLQGDVLADEGLHEFGQVADDRVGVGAFGLDGRAAAEAEQLPGQGRGPVGRLQDLRQVAVRLLIGRQLAQDAAGVAADHLQEVVEFMGDAPGELPHALELLRLAEFRAGVGIHDHLRGRVGQVGQKASLSSVMGCWAKAASTPVVLPRASCNR